MSKRNTSRYVCAKKIVQDECAERVDIAAGPNAISIQRIKKQIDRIFLDPIALPGSVMIA